MGVLIGLAGMKLSGSPRLYGKINEIVRKGIIIKNTPSVSFEVKNG
jgi:hypothetical protein